MRPAKERLLIFLLFLHWIIPSYAQQDIEVTQPRLSFANDSLLIEYDILYSKPSDIFKVWIEVTDATGKNLNTVTLSGDIGDNIKGGTNKKIAWSLATDSIFIEGQIRIKVNAEKQVTADTETIPSYTQPQRGGNYVLSSMIFPGLGLSRLHKSSAYWLFGVMGYGCIATSLVYNKKAVLTYKNYVDSYDLTESKDLYEQALQYDKISKICAYSAIGIWVIDFIWTASTPKNIDSTIGELTNKRVSIRTYYHPKMNRPLLTLSYKF
ncbi:MAG: hypothetical protein KAX05_07200 [Bacteroidales bacterium]|nr:hypothetical protein [Bacteroidales bacterium]